METKILIRWFVTVVLSLLAAQPFGQSTAAACPVTLNQAYKHTQSNSVWYVSENCKKRPIKNPDVFFSHFSSWGDVRTVSRNTIEQITNHELGFLPWGTRRAFQSGSLIKTVDDPKVYLKINNTIYPIASESAFRSLGLEFSMIEDVVASVISSLQVGEEVEGIDTSPGNFVFKYPNNPSVYVLVYDENGNQYKRHITSFTDLKRDYRIDRIAVISASTAITNSPLGAVPVGELITNLSRPREQGGTQVNTPQCGNGIIEAGEFCDDGSLNGSEGECNNSCSALVPVSSGRGSSSGGGGGGGSNSGTTAVCGNGTVESSEVCDSGSQMCSINGYSGTQSCNSSCTGYNSCSSSQSCGDGIVNGAETCDDGNNTSGDGCSASCLVESSPAPTTPPPSTDIDEGWTSFTPSGDTRRVYLSANGSDSNDCLSEQSACRTIDRGYQQMRDGYPDWLLLRRGDTFSGTFYWNKSGRSSSEMMVIGTYGTSSARPVVQSGTESGFHHWWRPQDNSWPHAIRHLAIVGISFYAHSNTAHTDSLAGIFIGGPIENILVEDCHIENYNSGVAIQGTDAGQPNNIVFRRNIIVSNWVHGGDSEGIYIGGTSNAQLIENVFDHNGWQEGYTPWSIFTLNAYTGYGSPGIIVRGNIFSRADGIDMRSGGTLENNLFLRSSVAATFGLSHYGSSESNVTGRVTNNVFLEGTSLDPDLPRGFGLEINNTQQVEVDHNIFTNSLVAGTSIRFSPYNDPGIGVHNVNVHNNIVYNGGSASFGGRDNDPRSNITIQNNTFQSTRTFPEWGPFIDVTNLESGADIDLSEYTFLNNRYNAQGQLFRANETPVDFAGWQAATGDSGSAVTQVTFPNPSRNITSYDSSIGGSGSFTSFISGVRSLSKGSALNQPANASTWRVQYTADAVNDYIRAGFGL